MAHSREWHYKEADRLLGRAAEISEEYAKLDTQAFDRKIQLKDLGEIVSLRAGAHATLALASKSVSEG